MTITKIENIKNYLIIFLILASLNSFSQENETKTDLRFGIGFTLLGSGDMISTTIENELNYKMNRFITGSISISSGRSNFGVNETTSFLQGNTNLFVSPFKNSRKLDFRIGTGLTYYNVSDAYLSGQWYDENGVLVDEDYEFRKRTSFGFNMIIENTLSISNRLLLGVKLYSQPYFNGDINSGFLIKLGVKL